jgi:hypothetical protein
MELTGYRTTRFTRTDFLFIEKLFSVMAWIFVFALLNFPTEIPIVAYVVLSTFKLKFKIFNALKSHGFVFILIALLSLALNFEREFFRNLFDYVQFFVGVYAAHIFVSLVRKRMLLSDTPQQFKNFSEMSRQRRSLIHYGVGLLLATGVCIALNNLGADPDGGGVLKTGLAEARLVFPFAFGVLVFLLSGYRERALLSILALTFVILGNSKVLLFTTIIASIVALSHKSGVKRIISVKTIALALVKFITGIVVSLALLLIFNPERFKDIFSPQDSLSTMVRLSLIRTSLEAAINNPLLGTGPSGINLSVNYDRYHANDGLEDFIEAGIMQGHAAIFENGFTSGAHNGYADLLASYGWVFFILFILWLLKGGIIAFQAGILPLKILFVLVILTYFEWQYSQLSYGVAMSFLFFGLQRLPIKAERGR